MAPVGGLLVGGLDRYAGWARPGVVGTVGAGSGPPALERGAPRFSLDYGKGIRAQRLHYAAPGDGAMTMVASVVGCALIAAGVWGSISELWKKA